MIVATNAYFLLGLRLIKSFSHHYKGDYDLTFFLFSDRNPEPYLCVPEDLHHYYVGHGDWVEAVQSKYECILKYKNILNEEFSHFFFVDADTSIQCDFSDDLFWGESVGMKHRENDARMIEIKDFDRNPLSAAYIPIDTKRPQTYYHGCFWGGSTRDTLSMCETLMEAQRRDKRIDYVPVWHDESYINHYFHYNPPSRVIDPFAEFKFRISDKAYLNIDRNPNFDISHHLQTVAQNRSKTFQIDSSGAITFQHSVAQPAHDSTDLRCRAIGQKLRPAPGVSLVESNDRNQLTLPGLEEDIFLNDSALMIWRLCDGTRAAHDIINLLLDNFPDDVESISADVPQTIDRLFHIGAIEQVPVAVSQTANRI